MCAYFASLRHRFYPCSTPPLPESPIMGNRSRRPSNEKGAEKAEAFSAPFYKPCGKPVQAGKAAFA
jgi:hypothetical protein